MHLMQTAYHFNGTPPPTGAYHLITVTTLALTYHCLYLSLDPDLKLISFANPFLHSHSYSFRTAFTDLNLY